MTKRINALILACVLIVLTLLPGCQNAKKFDSIESMISEVKGTYSGSGEYADEQIIIDEKNVIRFNIEKIFPKITEEDFFWENFENENWENFDINAMLDKDYIEIIKESISVDINKSTISGLLVNKNGDIITQEDYSLSKISSDSTYPTEEMRNRFQEYCNYLKEYEKSIIIFEAENDFKQKQESLNSCLSSATSSNSSYTKSSASAETIANCALDSLKDHIKYPRTAKLEGYSTNPQYDSYGRVATLISVATQNAFGNYITEDVYVVLQSCSSSGSYTYKLGGIHYNKTEDYFNLLLAINGWEQDPDTDSVKEVPYNEAIELIRNKEYLSAANKLEPLGDYKSSLRLKEACENIVVASKYKDAIMLFSNGQYVEASNALTALLQDCDTAYLRTERVIALCNSINKNTENNVSNSNDNVNSENNETSSASSSKNSSNNSSSTHKETFSGNKTSSLTTSTSSSNNSSTGKENLSGNQTSNAIISSSNSTDSTNEEYLSANKTSTTTNSSSNISSANKGTLSSNKTSSTNSSSNISSANKETSDIITSTSSSTPDSSQENNPCSGGHTWKAVTIEVRHEEQGHYEQVKVADAYTWYRCGLCSKEFKDKSQYYSHFDTTHTDAFEKLLRETYVQGTVSAEYEEKWIIDKEAYDETVVTGHECSVCGETK